MGKSITIDKDELKELIRETVKETIIEITTTDNGKLIELIEDALLVHIMDNEKIEDEECIDGREYHKMLRERINK